VDQLRVEAFLPHLVVARGPRQLNLQVDEASSLVTQRPI
jgi:hypothetical protein